jgi:hypothetical protein
VSNMISEMIWFPVTISDVLSMFSIFTYHRYASMASSFICLSKGSYIKKNQKI